MNNHRFHLLAVSCLLAGISALSLTGACGDNDHRDPLPDPLPDSRPAPTCVPLDEPCNGTLACCTGSCVSGTCDDLCSPNPCQNGGTCAVTNSSYTCTCTGGYTGTNCETPPLPAEPTIGCHDYPGNSGNTGVDDLYYSGPIDTINNIRFHRAPRDGTCTGSSFQNGGLIKAASAAEANTKCGTLIPNGQPAFDASIWTGLTGFWICQ
jgi:hypothetical protein